MSNKNNEKSQETPETDKFQNYGSYFEDAMKEFVEINGKKDLPSFLNELNTDDNNSHIYSNLIYFVENNYKGYKEGGKSLLEAIKKDKVYNLFLNPVDILKKIKKISALRFSSFIEKRKLLPKTFHTYYKIPDSYKDKLTKAIENLDEVELNDLLKYKSTKKRDEFLKKHLGDFGDQIVPIGFIDFIKDLNSGIDFSQLPHEIKMAITRVYKTNSQVIPSDIYDIVKNIFNDDLKKIFISFVKPTITLQELVDLGILTKKEALDKSKVIMEQNGFSIETIKDISDDSIDLSNYTVDTAELVNEENSIFASQIFDENDPKEDYFSEVAELVNEEKKDFGPKTFKDFKNEILSLVSNIDTFSSGNYLEFTKKDENGKTVVSYFQVGRVDLYGENTFEMRAVGENGIFYGYTDYPLTEVSYKQFIDTFSDGFSIKAVNQEYIKNSISQGDLKLKDGITDLLPNEKLETQLEIESIDKQISSRRKDLTDPEGDFRITDKEIDDFIAHSKQKQEYQKVSDYSSIEQFLSNYELLGFENSQEFKDGMQLYVSQEAGYLLSELEEISLRINKNFFISQEEKEKYENIQTTLNNKLKEIEKSIAIFLCLKYIIETQQLPNDQIEQINSFISQIYLKLKYDKISFLNDNAQLLQEQLPEIDSTISSLQSDATKAEFVDFLKNKKSSIPSQIAQKDDELSSYKNRLSEIEIIFAINKKLELEKELSQRTDISEERNIKAVQIEELELFISSKGVNTSLASPLSEEEKDELKKEQEFLNKLVDFSNGYENFVSVKNKLDSIYSNDLKQSLQDFFELYQKREELEEKLEVASDNGWEKLLLLLDSTDSNGSKIKSPTGITGLFEGMLIQDFENKDSINTYRVITIDKNEGFVTIISEVNGKIEKLSFENFGLSFKSASCKRMLSYGAEHFLSQIQNSDNNWKNYVLTEDGFCLKTDEPSSKDNEKDGKIPVDNENNGKILEYLKNEKGEIIKIEGVSGNNITITFGKYGENPDQAIKDHHTGEVIAKHKDLTLSSVSQIMSFTAFKRFLDLGGKEKFQPTHEFKNQKAKYKREIYPGQNPFKYYLKHCVSLGEMAHGFQQVGKSIEHLLEKNEHVHSSHFALMLGNLIPIEEVQSTLRTDVEGAEEEAMRKEVKSLSSVDSPIATARIRRWLKSRTSMDYQKEAGVIFMLEKYGELYAKELAKDKGSFLWYQALGGFVGDQLFKDVEQECRDLGVGFDEKLLVHRLLKKQCKGHGYRGIHRRSRLHKEYENAWKSGESSEYDKGMKDGGAYSTTLGRLKGGLDELYGGTVPNAIGWFLKVLEKGGTIEELSEGYFALIASGVLYGESNNVFNLIKGIWTKEQIPMILARFSGSVGDIQLVNDTILELSKDISKLYPGKFPNLEADAKKLYKNSRDTTVSEEKRLKFAQKFWKNYGKLYTRSLNMTNQAEGVEEYGKVDKIIYTKGQEDKNSVYAKYFNRVGDFTEESNFKEEYINDGFVKTGISGLNMVRVAGMYFKFTETGSLKNGDAAKNFWKEYVYSVDNALLKYGSREEAKKFLARDLGSVVKKLVQNHSGSGILKNYNDRNTLFGADLNRWGINIEKISEMGADNYTNSMEFSQVVENILDKKSNHITPSSEIVDVGGAVSVLLGINKIKAANDGLYEKAA